MKEITAKLKEAGYKLTKPREAVLLVLQHSEKPLSIRMIFEKTKGVDLVSVYRTLKLLEKLSLVNAENFGGEKIYCLASHPHHHIICRKCGRMESFECHHQFDNLRNFTDIKHQMMASGICNKCNK